MIPVRSVEAAVAMTVLAVIGSASGFPIKYFEYRHAAPVRLTVHAPTSGSDIALARGQALHPFLNPGIVPGSYVLVNDLFPAGHHDYGMDPYARNQVVVFNNPELGNLHIGTDPNIGFY